MKKYGKILAALMAAMMLLASVMGVSAANSPTSDVTVAGDSVSKYDIADKDNAFKEYETTDQDMYDKFVGFNDGSVKKDELLEDASDDVKKELKDKTPITKVYELVDIRQNPDSGKHEVTLNVPTLTDNLEDVVLVNYENGKWVVVKPTKIDGKLITVELDDVGVFGIFASVKTGGGNAGDSATTGGTNSTWMLVVAAALVAVGVVVVASQKKNRG